MATEGEKLLKICLFVLRECTNVTDTETHRQTDRHTDRHTHRHTHTLNDGIGRACIASCGKKQSPSQATWVHWAALIFVSLVLSQTPANIARPRIRASASRGVPVSSHLSPVLIASTYEGMSRLS